MKRQLILLAASLILVATVGAAVQSGQKLTGLLERCMGVEFVGFRADSLYDKNGVLISRKIQDGAIGIARVTTSDDSRSIRPALCLTLANGTSIVIAGDLGEVKAMTKADWEVLQRILVDTASEAIDESQPD